MYSSIQLLPGKEASVMFGHPWIFSGALSRASHDVLHGSFVCVLDAQGRALGTGSYSRNGSIAVRLFDRAFVSIDQAWLEHRLDAAMLRRVLMGYGPSTSTTGYRVVFGETDGIPGLVVDRFEDVVVFQIATAALDTKRQEIIGAIKNILKPEVIIERSDIVTREEEGLESVVAVHVGSDPGTVTFLENSLRLRAEPLTGQKTGFFLDQKALRQWILEHSSVFDGKQVLNVFSYSGATGIAAMKAGAERVLNVDSSQQALEGCLAHAKLNDVPLERFDIQKEDAFQCVGNASETSYDIVIIDPPALIKSRRDVEQGKKAYHFLNRAAMRLVKDGGVLITSSCSHFLSEEDFAFLLRRGSIQSNCMLETLATISQSPDHPSSIYFPESRYLKTFCFRVVR